MTCKLSFSTYTRPLQRGFCFLDGVCGDSCRAPAEDGEAGLNPEFDFEQIADLRESVKANFAKQSYAGANP
jgi:hypothetical protein